MSTYEDTKTLKCSFCGKTERQVNRLLYGNGAFICDECVAICYNMLVEEGDLTAYTPSRKAKANPDDILKPKEIKEILDQYIIGQDDAKRTLAVSVYNHYKRIYFDVSDNEVEIQKSNVLLLGPTGVGKTLLAQTLAKILKVPFAIADATTLTQAGYVGEDVENVLLRLIQAADYDIEAAERGIIYIDEINQEFIQIDTKNILFICGGAFDGLEKVIRKRSESTVLGFGSKILTEEEKSKENVFSNVLPQDLVKFGIIPELVGRLPVVASLSELDKDSLIKILTEPKNALVKQYKSLFGLDDIELEFTDDALSAIAEKAVERKTGARGLRTIMEETLNKVMFDAPSDDTIRKITVTADAVNGVGEPEIICGEKKASKKSAKQTNSEKDAV